MSLTQVWCGAILSPSRRCLRAPPPHRHIACGARDRSTTEVLDPTHHLTKFRCCRSPPIALIAFPELPYSPALSIARSEDAFAGGSVVDFDRHCSESQRLIVDDGDR